MRGFLYRKDIHMDLDTTRVRELLDLRDQIDQDIRNLVNGTEVKERKPIKCSVCQGEGHTARTCPKRMPPPQA